MASSNLNALHNNCSGEAADTIMGIPFGCRPQVSPQPSLSRFSLLHKKGAALTIRCGRCEDSPRSALQHYSQLYSAAFPLCLPVPRIGQFTAPVLLRPADHIYLRAALGCPSTRPHISSCRSEWSLLKSFGNPSSFSETPDQGGAPAADSASIAASDRPAAKNGLLPAPRVPTGPPGSEGAE